MQISNTLASFIVGCLICAVLTGTAIRNDSANSWIPITALFFALAYLAFIIRSAISSINKRLDKMEQQS
jgi:CDP-diglyceride synthetase